MEVQSDSTGNFKLWSELELHEFPNKFVIKSIESPDQGFSISRFDGNINDLDGQFFSLFLPCENFKICFEFHLIAQKLKQTKNVTTYIIEASFA